MLMRTPPLFPSCFRFHLASSRVPARDVDPRKLGLAFLMSLTSSSFKGLSKYSFGFRLDELLFVQRTHLKLSWAPRE